MNRSTSRSITRRACPSGSTRGTRPVELVAKLNAIGARHGIGRIDLVENRLVGMKSHGVYETPGGTILYRGHQALEQLCLARRHCTTSR